MLIVLLDEPGLFVYASPEAAQTAIEPPGAESAVRAAFDEHAVPYRVEWARPNQTKKLLGLFRVISFGTYRWVAAGPPDPAALIQLIEEHPSTDPPTARADLIALLPKLRAV